MAVRHDDKEIELELESKEKQSKIWTAADLYDDSDNQYSEENLRLKLNPNLTAEQVEQAMRMAQWTHSGTIVVSGPLGFGKTCFADTSAWLLKYFFGRQVILDYKPRSLFGEYLPFAVIIESYNTCIDELKRQKLKIKDPFQYWLDRYGISLLKGKVMCWDEFWKMCKKRRTSSNINYFATGIIKLSRRLDLLIFGMTPSADEIDQQEVIPYCTSEARCIATTQPGVFQVNLYPRRYVDATGAWEMTGKVRTIILDGLRPREELNGKCYLDLYPSKLPKAQV